MAKKSEYTIHGSLLPGEEEEPTNIVRGIKTGLKVGGAVLTLAVVTPNLIAARDEAAYGPPRIVKVPYKVGFKTEEQLVSEISSDMHQVAPNQDPNEANSVIRTYLPKEDQAHYDVHGGERFVFSVDKSSGKILPKPNSPSSGENG